MGRLYRDDDYELTRDMMSKGELQLYATAIVWGLAKTSGRPLPFIIDTPLARLDVEHRENVIESFYPVASHQVIILSTNSEITKPYYARLEPYVSRSMRVHYDDTKNKVVHMSGYL